MRYVIEVTDKGCEERVWNTINRLQGAGLLTIVEKGDPVENLKESMRRMVRAAEILRKSGIDRDMMEIYLAKKADVPITHVRAILDKQDQFFARIGIKLK